MTDAPERTWVTFEDGFAPWCGVAYERKANADAVEYVRADLSAQSIRGAASVLLAIPKNQDGLNVLPDYMRDVLREIANHWPTKDKSQ